MYIVEYFQPALNDWIFITLFFDSNITLDDVKERVLSLRASGFNYPLRIVSFFRETLFSLEGVDL